MSGKKARNIEIPKIVEWIYEKSKNIVEELFITIGFFVLHSVMYFFPYILVILFLFYRPFWILGLLHILWVYIDRKTPFEGSRWCNFTRNWCVWKFAKNYFPIRLIKTAELPPDKNYILCCFPHGVIPFGPTMNFATTVNKCDLLFPGIKPHVTMLDCNFVIPLFRDVSLLLGVCPVSERSITYLLQQPPSKAVVLFPGGLSELTKCATDAYRIELKRRKGFVRVALKTGSSLVPVFTYGETFIFRQPSGKFYKKIQSAIYSKFHKHVFLVWGSLFNLSFGPFPFKHPVTTVVGKPLYLPKIIKPTNEDIDKYHSMFEKELVNLFEENRSKYDINGQNAKLVIE